MDRFVDEVKQGMVIRTDRQGEMEAGDPHVETTDGREPKEATKDHQEKTNLESTKQSRQPFSFEPLMNSHIV